MRPGMLVAMGINDLHVALGRGSRSIASYPKPRGRWAISLRGRGYSATGCAAGKGIPKPICKTTTCIAPHALFSVCFYADLMGPFSRSAGGSTFCLCVVKDCTNYGLAMFFKDNTAIKSQVHRVRTLHLVQGQGTWLSQCASIKRSGLLGKVRKIVVDPAPTNKFCSPAKTS